MLFGWDPKKDNPETIDFSKISIFNIYYPLRKTSLKMLKIFNNYLYCLIQIKKDSELYKRSISPNLN